MIVCLPSSETASLSPANVLRSMFTSSSSYGVCQTINVSPCSTLLPTLATLNIFVFLSNIQSLLLVILQASFSAISSVQIPESSNPSSVLIIAILASLPVL